MSSRFSSLHPGKFSFFVRSTEDRVRRFHEIVRRSPLILAMPTQRLASCEMSRRVVIGIALWSGPDLDFLDKVVTELKKHPSDSIRVEVFCVDLFSDMKEFDQFFPDCPRYPVTPVIGMWLNGKYGGASFQPEVNDLPRRLIVGDLLLRWERNVANVQQT